jgi:hypothetical protein
MTVATVLMSLAMTGLYGLAGAPIGAYAATSPFAGGNGTSTSPYEIDTPTQLEAMATCVNTGGAAYAHADYALCNNIDLGNVPFTPIGTNSISFEGTFDGNGHAICNLTVSTSSRDYVGLFGSAYDATIENLTLKGATVTQGGCDGTGALLGYASGDSHVNNVTACNVSVTGTHDCTGGLMGYVAGSISDLHATNVSVGVPSGDYKVGGIAANADATVTDVTLSHITATGGSSCVGGLAGELLYHRVTDVTAQDVAVSATGRYVGGLVGDAEEAPMEDVYLASGSVQVRGGDDGSRDVGGLVGYAECSELQHDEAADTVSVCSSGDVGEVGGLAGCIYN